MINHSKRTKKNESLGINERLANSMERLEQLCTSQLHLFGPAISVVGNYRNTEALNI